MAFARDISDRLCAFFGRRIEVQGTPAERFANPRKERARRVLSAVESADR